MSIRPNYAQAILAGTKTIELRRRVPDLFSGMRLWIYETLPTGAVVGFARVQSVAKARPTTIWRKHRDAVGIDYASFTAYFDGAPEAVAIGLATASRVAPITLDQLRQVRDSFHPPRVLMRLTPAESKVLRKFAVAA